MTLVEKQIKERIMRQIEIFEEDLKEIQLSPAEKSERDRLMDEGVIEGLYNALQIVETAFFDFENQTLDEKYKKRLS